MSSARIWWSKRVVLDGPPYRLGPAALHMEGDRIVRRSEGPKPEGAVDFGDKLITPAFVNTHTHLALVALRGFDASAAAGNVVEDLFYRFEQELEPADVAAFARVGAYEALMNGIGVVWDHYFHARALAEAVEKTGLALVMAPTLQDLAGPGTAWLDAALEETSTLQRPGSGVFAAIGPHATDTVSAELWQRACTLADSLDVPLHAHLAQSFEEHERANARHECSPLAWLESLGVLEHRALFAHGLFLNDEDLRRLSGKQTLVACPMAQSVFAFPVRTEHWSKQGMQWTVATDAAASNDSHNLLKELRALARRPAFRAADAETYTAFFSGAASPADVWRIRSSERFDGPNDGALLDRIWGFAGSLHPSFRAGVLEAGALANVLVWDTDHPAFWPATRPLHTLVHGDVSGALFAMLVRNRVIGAQGDVAGSLRRSQAYVEALNEAKSRLETKLTKLYSGHRLT